MAESEQCMDIVDVSGYLLVMLGDIIQHGGPEPNTFTHANPATLDVHLGAITRLRNEAITPIYRLGDDLLSYIFAVPYVDRWDRQLLPPFAEAVSMVSVRWRGVAQDTPQLWATIVVRQSCCTLGLCPTVKPRELPPALHPKVNKILRAGVSKSEAIKRSKAVPLRIEVGHNTEREAAQMLTALNNAVWLSSTTPQVTEIYWNADSEQMLSLLVRMVRDHQKSLTILHIKWDGLLGHPALTVLDDVCGMSIPTLHILHLHFTGLPRTFSAFSECRTVCFLLPQIFYGAGFLELLQSCNQVTRLDVHYLQSPSVRELTLDVPGNSLHLRRLRHLRLVGPVFDILSLLHTIHAPDLESLLLKKTDVIVEESLTAIVNEALISSPHLRSPVIPAAQPQSLARILRHAGELRTLDIGQVDVDFKAFFAEMQAILLERPAAPSPPAPMLESIRILVEAEYPYALRQFAEVIQQFLRVRRTRPGVSPIRRMDFYTTNEVYGRDFRVLKDDVDYLVIDGRRVL